MTSTLGSASQFGATFHIFITLEIIQRLIFIFFFLGTSWTNDKEPEELSDIFLLLLSCFLLDENKTWIIFLSANETWNQNQKEML